MKVSGHHVMCPHPQGPWGLWLCFQGPNIYIAFRICFSPMPASVMPGVACPGGGASSGSRQTSSWPETPVLCHEIEVKFSFV